MALMDVWDQTVLTKLVKRNLEETANQNTGGEDRSLYGATIAPLTPVASRTTRIRVADVKPYGKGQFKAPDATPPLFKTKPTLKEQVIELALLEEMERFTGEEWMMLNSSDPALANGAKLDLLQRLRIMTNRNDRLTEWMRWEAFKGTLTISYPDGDDITVDYGIPGTHFPTVATAWSDTVNANPIEDLYAWAQIGADDAGQFYSRIHLNSMTYRLLQMNEKVRGFLSSLGRTILLPTDTDIAALLRSGTGNFVITDAGYLPDNATNYELTKYIPDERVLMTTEYVVAGERIADVADGQVLVGGDGTTAPSIRQGIQSEVMTNPFSKNVFRRVASARVPRIYLPEAFLYADVS